MPDPKHDRVNFESLDQDVSALKVQVGQLGTEIKNVKGEMTEIKSGIGAIQSALTSIQKPDKNLLVNAIAAAVTIGALLWGLAIRPTDMRVTDHDNSLSRHSDRIEAGARADTRHDAMFREVEGQIKALSKLNNQRAQYQHLLLQMTWQRANGQPVQIPALDYWPEIGEQWED